MKALSLWQPWAWLVAAGIKRIENRPWICPPAYRDKQIAIHASKHFDEEGLRRIREIAPEIGISMRCRELGLVVGVATIAGCIVDTGPMDFAGSGAVVDTYEAAAGWPKRVPPIALDQARWFFGPYGILLDNACEVIEGVRDLQPFRCPGRQRWFDLPADVALVVKERLGG